MICLKYSYRITYILAKISPTFMILPKYRLLQQKHRELVKENTK